MASAAAVAQFRNRVEDFRRIHLLVISCLVVIGMTARTIRLVGGELPGHGFAVAAMAGHAADPPSMVARVIGRLVTVAGHIPVIGVMTAITFSRGAKVAGGLAPGSGAIVTARTIAADIGMVEVRRSPCAGGMAQFAVVVGDDMGGALARGGIAVVAAGAAALHRRVIHPGHRLPDFAVVAQFTAVAAGNMTGVLSGRSAAVVTAGAVSGNRRMIEGSRFPGLGTVAEITGSRGNDMLRSLSSGYGTIVTTLAATGHRTMIHLDCRRPGIAVVA